MIMEINYSISRIDETKYVYDFDYDYTNLNKDQVVFEFKHGFRVNKEKEEVIIDLSACIKDQVTSTRLAENSIRTTFMVTPFDAFVKDVSENGIKVSESGLMDTFISITIGALRGIMSKNLKQTSLENYVLPLVPMNFIHSLSSKESK